MECMGDDWGMGKASRDKWERKIAYARLEGEKLANPPKTRWERTWSWSSVGAIILACAGFGVGFMTSSHTNVADGFFAATAVLFVLKWRTWEEEKDNSTYLTLAINGIATIICLAALIGTCYWNHRINRPKQLIAENPADHPPKPPTSSKQFVSMTVRQLYDQDSVGQARLSSVDPNIIFTHGKHTLHVRQATLENSKSKTFVESYYVPNSPLSADFLLSLSTKGASVNRMMLKTVASLQSRGDLPETPLPEQGVVLAGGYSFGNKIFFYHEDKLLLSVRAQAEKALDAQGISIEFRGPEYALAQFMTNTLQAAANNP